MAVISKKSIPQPGANMQIALVGNPNCGKTTLFNTLTGAQQRVGNWSGVTIESKSGYFQHNHKQIRSVDLPGTYTLTRLQTESPQDEMLTSAFLKSHPCQLILNVVDAVNLERNLYLSLQLIEQQLPVVIALNRMDLMEKAEHSIHIESLAEQLGCRIVPVIARNGIGIEGLKEIVSTQETFTGCRITYQPSIEAQIQILTEACQAPRYQVIRWLEGEASDNAALVLQAQQAILAQTGQEADVLIASRRYQLIEEMVASTRRTCKVPQKPSASTMSRGLDRIACHRYLGIPFFLGVMYALFFFAINIGGAFQDFFELSADAFFVEGFAVLLHQLHTPEWLMALLVSGLGKGISTVLTFIPVIGAMFLALAFLEDSGYMARAAFVIDRLMRAIGLPGKSFVPMIVGFGCNVPAIMGMRTLENKRDRILAVMMSPFMSCGARLAIFTVFVAAFFPRGGKILFSCFISSALAWLC